jgi:cytochrome c-type biogenesis protein CcmH/NrfG
MANLTLSFDDELLRRARIRALERGTTVNTLVREYLEGFVGTDPTRSALDSFLALTEETSASSGEAGRTWTRDDLYTR